MWNPPRLPPSNHLPRTQEICDSRRSMRVFPTRVGIWFASHVPAGYFYPMHNQIENLIEAVLWKSRWMVFLAVIGSILAALMLMIMGAVDIAMVLKNGLLLAAGAISSEHFQETSVGTIIRAVDAFLIGTVMLIFGLGLYELFICKIHAADGEAGSANVLVVHSLDQLKEKIG